MEPIVCTYGKLRSQFWQSNASGTWYFYCLCDWKQPEDGLI